MTTNREVRHDLAAVLYSWGNRVLSWEGVCKHDEDERDLFLAYADDILAVLAISDHRTAILEAMNLDVTPGWEELHTLEPQWTITKPTTTINPVHRVLVVRPRGVA